MFFLFVEEVCEKLETCIETGEGGLEARTLQVYQTWRTIHRSLRFHFFSLPLLI